MKLLLALLFLSANCFGAPIKKVGDTFHGKVGNVDFEVGAIVSNKIKPQLKLVKWGEDSLIVNFPSMGSINKTAASTNGSTVTFNCSAGKLLVYVTDDGHIEYEGLFNSVPWSSVQLTLTGWENFDFFYQGELTAEEIADGSIRPDNVVGSYAVYHKTKRNNKYQTGKVFHIYRPCWIAADGQRLWITQSIVNGVWKLSWDKTWTDSAAKPLTLDPTFGLTTAGGTQNNNNSGYARACKIVGLSPTGTNTMIKIYVYCLDHDTNGNMKLYLYNEKDGKPNAQVYADANANNTPQTTAAWITSNSANYSLVASTQYWAATYTSANALWLYYDSGDYMSYFDLDQVPPANPWTNYSSPTASRNYSIYVEYTAQDAPAPSVPLLPQGLIWEN